MELETSQRPRPLWLLFIVMRSFELIPYDTYVSHSYLSLCSTHANHLCPINRIDYSKKFFNQLNVWMRFTLATNNRLQYALTLVITALSLAIAQMQNNSNMILIYCV